MTTDSIEWRPLPALLASLALWGCGGNGSTALEAVRSAGLVQGAPAVVTDAAGNQVVSVAVLTQGGVKTLSTGAVSPAAAQTIRASLVPGNLVDWIPVGSDKVTVPQDATQTFNVVLSKGSSAAAQFNLQKYGAAITRHNGQPGPMVAAGWVYSKADGKITIGDGRTVTADQAGRPYDKPIRRYEETYAVASDAVVFNVNTDDYAKSTVSSFGAIPVTANYDYGTTARQAAYVLFDRNYLQADAAKVVAIWYFTPSPRPMASRCGTCLRKVPCWPTRAMIRSRASPSWPSMPPLPPRRPIRAAPSPSRW